MATPSLGPLSFLHMPSIPQNVPYYQHDHLPFPIPHWRGPHLDKMTSTDWIFQYRTACEFFRDYPEYAWVFSAEYHSRRAKSLYTLNVVFEIFCRLFYNVEVGSYLEFEPMYARGDPLLCFGRPVTRQNAERAAVRKLKPLLRRISRVATHELFGVKKQRRLGQIDPTLFIWQAPDSAEHSFSIAYPIHHYRPRLLADKLRAILTPHIQRALPLGNDWRCSLRPTEHPHHYSMFELILHVYLDL